MREGGAEALAFDVACLSAGRRPPSRTASPARRRVRAGRVLLFDFGAQVAGYRSDMTRTLFVGRALGPRPRRPRPGRPGPGGGLRPARGGGRGRCRRPGAAPLPSGRAVDAAARDVIEAAGHGPHFGHGTGHGIGLATHERPSLSRVAADEPLPSPTVFSIEPGVYLAGRTGVRIEDLVLLDAAARRVERLTRFPREVMVLPA